MEMLRVFIQGLLAMSGAMLCICAGAVMAVLCAMIINALAEYVVIPFVLLVLDVFGF